MSRPFDLSVFVAKYKESDCRPSLNPTQSNGILERTLRARGVHFQIATLNIDTSTPAGIFVYTMLSALAEFERRTLSQRTKEGMEAARRNGAQIGRPRALTDEQLRTARREIEGGKPPARVARELGVYHYTLSRSLKRQTASTGAMV